MLLLIAGMQLRGTLPIHGIGGSLAIRSQICGLALTNGDRGARICIGILVYCGFLALKVVNLIAPVLLPLKIV